MIALWIAYAVMISVLLSGAALGLERALRLYGRSARWVWAGVIVGGLATPLAIFFLPMLPAGPESVAVVLGPPGVGAILLDPLVMAFTPPASLLEQLDAPLMALWAAMTLVLVLLVTGGALRLARQRKRWTRRPLEGDRVLISENFGPAVIGLRHPEIVLPEWTLGMAPEDLRLVMMHEREHQKAGDTQLLTAGLLSVLLMPWNPALWWQLRRLRGAVELDCDARVLRSGVSGPEYGALLLRMGERIGGMGLAMAALTEPKSLLEGRIRMITEEKPRGRLVRAAVALGLTATVLAVACETPTPLVVQEELDASAEPAANALGIVNEMIRITPDASFEDRLLVFVDGEVIEDYDLSELSPDDIERIEVIKGWAAVQIYGERAANGVIQIFLKENEIVTAGLVRSVVEVISKDRRKRARAKMEVVAEREVDPMDHPKFTPMTVMPEITNVVEVIQAMEQAYPKMLRDAGIGGRVVVWFFITETGEVADTEISQTSGFAPLDAAALSVANVYEFTPALNQDTPVPVWVQFPITFEVR